MGNHLELWDRTAYEAQEAQAMQGRCPMCSVIFPSEGVS